MQLLAHNAEGKRFRIHELFMVRGKTSPSLRLMKFIILKFKQNFLLEGTMHFFFFIFRCDQLSLLNFFCSFYRCEWFMKIVNVHKEMSFSS